jgi:hypothetical protein
MSIVRDLRLWPQLSLAWAGNDPLINRSRSIAASQFLDEPRYGDIFMMCDHDISWDDGSLQRLAREAYELDAVVGAVHSKRGFNLDLTCRPTDGTLEIDVGQDKVIPCSYVSTSLIAISRRLLEDLSKRMPRTRANFWPFFFPRMVEISEELVDVLGGDWSFCNLVCDELGDGRVFAHTGPIIGHTGEHIYMPGDTLTRTDDPVPIIPGLKDDA